VRVGGHLGVRVVEDLDLVAAAQVDAAVALRVDVELDVQLQVLEALLAHEVGVVLRLDHHELAVPGRPSRSSSAVAELPAGERLAVEAA
jgi:hypothetical protein